MTRYIVQGATWHDDVPVRVGTAHITEDEQEFREILESELEVLLRAPASEDEHIYQTITLRKDGGDRR